MTSSNHHPTTPRLTDRIARTMHRQAAVMIRLSIDLARRLDPPAPVSIVPDPAPITFVDDPDGRVRLIGVSGVVDRIVLDELWAAVESDESIAAVHIDLTATEIDHDDTDCVADLEAGFDRTERRGIRLRVVGLDPEHPALLRGSTR